VSGKGEDESLPFFERGAEERYKPRTMSDHEHKNDPNSDETTGPMLFITALSLVGFLTLGGGDAGAHGHGAHGQGSRGHGEAHSPTAEEMLAEQPAHDPDAPAEPTAELGMDELAAQAADAAMAEMLDDVDAEEEEVADEGDAPEGEVEAVTQPSLGTSASPKPTPALIAPKASTAPAMKIGVLAAPKAPAPNAPPAAIPKAPAASASKTPATPAAVATTPAAPKPASLSPAPVQSVAPAPVKPVAPAPVKPVAPVAPAPAK
jgi:hypothetical protein